MIEIKVLKNPAQIADQEGGSGAMYLSHRGFSTT